MKLVIKCGVTARVAVRTAIAAILRDPPQRHRGVSLELGGWGERLGFQPLKLAA